jgi:translocator protein
LVLNSLWSILFFGMKNPALAFGEIIILWLFIIVLIVLFYPLNKIASYLLIPYLLWVSFASILNFSIWQLNKNSIPFPIGNNSHLTEQIK